MRWRTPLCGVLAAATLAVAAPQDPPPDGAAPAGPSAVLVDRDGVRVAVRDLAWTVEESDGGMLYVSRLPYVPLRTGRGEWRIPLGAIRALTVAPPSRPAALAAPVQLAAQAAVRVDAHGTGADARWLTPPGSRLDASLLAWCQGLAFQAGTGPPAVTDRPIELRLHLQVSSAPVAGPPLPLHLVLELNDDTRLEGQPARVGVLTGRAGAGEFRLALADCARATMGEQPR